MFVLDYLAIYKFIGYKQEIKRTFIIPLISSVIMGALCIGVYLLFRLFLPDAIACVIAILLAVIAYAVSMILFKGISESDWNSVPMGNKILSLLKKLKIY